METYPFIRHLKRPVTMEQLRPLDARGRIVQFSASLQDSEMREVAQFLRDYPNVTVRVYGRSEEGFDFEFLKHFGFLRRFQADVFDIKSFAGMDYLPSDLEYLGIGEARNKNHSLRFLSRFASLRELYIDGHTRGIDVIAQLVALEELVVAGMLHLRPDAFRPFVGHPTLKRASVGLGSKRKNEAVHEILRLPNVTSREDFVFI